MNKLSLPLDLSKDHYDSLSIIISEFPSINHDRFDYLNKEEKKLFFEWGGRLHNTLSPKRNELILYVILNLFNSDESASLKICNYIFRHNAGSYNATAFVLSKLIEADIEFKKTFISFVKKYWDVYKQIPFGLNTLSEIMNTLKTKDRVTGESLFYSLELNKLEFIAVPYEKKTTNQLKNILEQEELRRLITYKKVDYSYLPAPLVSIFKDNSNRIITDIPLLIYLKYKNSIDENIQTKRIFKELDLIQKINIVDFYKNKDKESLFYKTFDDVLLLKLLMTDITFSNEDLLNKCITNDVIEIFKAALEINEPERVFAVLCANLKSHEDRLNMLPYFPSNTLQEGWLATISLMEIIEKPEIMELSIPIKNKEAFLTGLGALSYLMDEPHLALQDYPIFSALNTIYEFGCRDSDKVIATYDAMAQAVGLHTEQNPLMTTDIDLELKWN